MNCVSMIVFGAANVTMVCVGWDTQLDNQSSPNIQMTGDLIGSAVAREQ